MKLERLNTNGLDFAKLDEMITGMTGLLEDSETASLTIEELCSFQDTDGSFKLLDSYQVPSDARVDFCHKPTYIGAAILMKEYLGGQKRFAVRLEKALQASLQRDFRGHGYEAEEGCIVALKIFIKGGLHKFLETEREICPAFHKAIHNILHNYNSRLLRQDAIGSWGEDYSAEWKEIAENLHVSKRLYAAYGSNMDKSQMAVRCPNANVFGKAYLEDWLLTFPHYANVESKQGEKTPVLIWEITDTDEKALDIYEGYPNSYDKAESIVNIDGKFYSVMIYVMTDEHKGALVTPRKGYKQQILSGYYSAGFEETLL